MTDLYFQPGSDPAPLPFEAYDADGRLWTDLANNEEGVEACGFRKAPSRPDDTSAKVAEWDMSAEKWVMVDRPPAPPAPDPQPRTLGKLEFIGLAQSAGGMKDAMLVAAYKDPQLEAFWVKYQMASQVQRDNEVTTQALAALDALGYLPKGATAVIAAWPTA